jgi:hypothetical protein
VLDSPHRPGHRGRRRVRPPERAAGNLLGFAIASAHSFTARSRAYPAIVTPPPRGDIARSGTPFCVDRHRADRQIGRDPALSPDRHN